MKIKNKILAVSILVILVSSVYFSAMTKAVVASDQLELKVNSSVEGKVLYTNSTITDHPLFNVTISVDEIFNATDVALELYKIKVAYDVLDEEYFGGDGLSKMEMTHIVFKHNRTTLLAGARLFMGNATFSVELTVLHLNTVAEWQELNNTRITFNNGTSYVFGDMSPGDFGYNDIIGHMLGYAIINFGLTLNWPRTLIGINPTVNIGDTINFFDTTTDTATLGDVIETVEVTTTGGKAVDTIHVQFANNSLFGWDDFQCDAFYETKTGLLIRIIETDGTETYEFVPEAVNKVGLIPFPFSGIIVGFIAIGLIAIFTRRKKK